MKKLFTIVACLSILACNKPQSNSSTQSTAQDTTKNVNPSMAVKTENKSKDAIDFDSYLNKNELEQVKDSFLLAIVKPEYAIFTSTQRETETKSVQGYLITGFVKSNGQWTKSFTDTISDIQIFDNDKEIWKYEDINGDGAKDVLVKIYHDGKENTNFWCYLQSPSKKTFYKIAWFSDLINPVYDAKTKELSMSSVYSKGMNKEAYKWVGDSVKFIRGENMGIDAGKYTDAKKSFLAQIRQNSVN